MTDSPDRPETTATGIAGAADYVPAGHRTARCYVCGGDMDASRTRPSARIMPGFGVVQACSAACANDPKFAGMLVFRAERRRTAR